MNRYTSDDKPSMYKADNGEFYLVEDVEPIIVDRDIKAANLQLLVEKVLAASELYDLLQSDEDDAVTGIFSRSTKDAITKGKEALDLARSLKQ